MQLSETMTGAIDVLYDQQWDYEQKQSESQDTEPTHGFAGNLYGLCGVDGRRVDDCRTGQALVRRGLAIEVDSAGNAHSSLGGYFRLTTTGVKLGKERAEFNTAWVKRRDFDKTHQTYLATTYVTVVILVAVVATSREEARAHVAEDNKYSNDIHELDDGHVVARFAGGLREAPEVRPSSVHDPVDERLYYVSLGEFDGYCAKCDRHEKHCLCE